MNKIKNPCFDRETMTSCPRRCAGCSITCPDWSSYVAKRDTEYKAIAKQKEDNRRTYEVYARGKKFKRSQGY